MKVIIERGKVWDVESLAPKTIALDGAVQGPYIDANKEVYSFDHHANCIRLVTKATCAQVYDALSLGLNPEGFDILINDIDGDTVLSVWLLQNAAKINNPFTQELVGIVGNIDAHGPAYPLSASQADIAHKFYKGVMAPETKARFVDKNYGTIDLGILLDSCLAQLDLLAANPEGYLVGVSPQVDPEFEVTHKADNFVMVKSKGFAFGGCYKMGLNAVILYSDCPDGSIAYTIGKKSEFVGGFNVPAILTALNAVEAGWGGGSTIGGAPRNADGSRSRLTPDEVFKIASEV
jgi:hypothetical protein